MKPNQKTFKAQICMQIKDIWSEYLILYNCVQETITQKM